MRESAGDDFQTLESEADRDAEAGRVLEALRKYDEILRSGNARAAISRKTGEALLRVKEFAQAITFFRQALEQGDDSPATHHNLGRALFSMGDADAAVKCLHATMERTDQIDPWLGLANILPNAPSATHQDVLDARRAWARRAGDGVSKVSHWSAGAHGCPQIRVAYLSAHFHQRNYMKPVWGLIRHHDRERFQIHLLDDGSHGKQFEGYRSHPSDQIHEVSTLDNDALAELVRQQSIDILVDLSAYSYPERLSFFFSKLAPITAAWFNMYATSGLEGFDYIVGDRHVVKREEEAYYCEKVARLPLSYLTFQVDYPTPDIAALPCLGTGYFTFGSLVSQYKITSPVLDAWAAILLRARDSRLVLANTTLKSPHNRAYVVEKFLRRGVDGDRIEILPPADHDDFLRYYDRIDLALDAFPYNGGTTTMEALWQGVPVLTKLGDRWAARTSETLLFECDLSGYVAADDEDYVEIAVRHATDREQWPALAEQRKTMRDRLRASSACDSARLAREMESLYASWLEQ